MATGFEAFSLYGTINLVGGNAVIAKLQQINAQAAATAATMKANLSQSGLIAASGLTAASAGVGALGAGMTNLGQKLKPVGIGLLALSGAAIAVGANTVKAAMGFEKSMVEAYAVMENLTESQKKRMEDLALTLTRTSRFSAGEIAANYQTLARAGLEAEQMMLAQPLAIKYAQAANQDLTGATEDLVHVQNALGMADKDAVKNRENLARVADVLIAADIKAVGEAKNFANALTNDAGVAGRVLGKDIEELTAVMMAWAMQEDIGSEAGTHLQMVMRDLQRAVNKPQNIKAWEKYGIAIYDVNNEVRNLGDIFTDFDRVMTGMSDKEKRLMLTEMGFQDRAVKAITQSFGLSPLIKENEAYLRKATGSAAEVSTKQLENLADQLKIVDNRFNAVKITLGKELIPVVSRMVDEGGPIDKLLKKLEGWAEAFANLSPNKQEAIVETILNIGKLGAAILLMKPAGAILTAVSGGLASLGGAIAEGTLLSGVVAFGLKWSGVLATLLLVYEVLKMIFLMNNPEFLPITGGKDALTASLVQAKLDWANATSDEAKASLKARADTLRQMGADEKEALRIVRSLPKGTKTYGGQTAGTYATGTGDARSDNLIMRGEGIFLPPSGSTTDSAFDTIEQYLPPEDVHGAGGVFTRPTWGVIGESGPEAVIPLDRAGGMLGNAMGGHYTMDINVTVTGGELDEARLTRVAEAGLMQLIRKGDRRLPNRAAMTGATW